MAAVQAAGPEPTITTFSGMTDPNVPESGILTAVRGRAGFVWMLGGCDRPFGFGSGIQYTVLSTQYPEL
jgi:hypothetical protein